MPEKKVYPVCVVGFGLAGSECAWQLGRRGIPVALVEMRPLRFSPAHRTDKGAELVCSNSFRSRDVSQAVGLLKEEMASLDSLVIRAAFNARVPAGASLSVDRERFSEFVTDYLDCLGRIHHISDVVVSLSRQGDRLRVNFESGKNLLANHCVIATGPLTEDRLAAWIREYTQQDYLYFYDSIAPIVERDSIDIGKAFRQSRYNMTEGTAGDYINCPMTRDEYEAFVDAIERAELVAVKDFDRAQFFEGCLPVEEMVRRGRDTLRFGPMKPVGLTNPHDPVARYHAVVQLRQDNLHGTLYNMVGFQTRMKWEEQKHIFRMIPGLENAEFVRLGSMHRNTYICSPVLLEAGMAFKNFPGVYFAGQITGCEGYVESAATGLYVGLFLAHLIDKKTPLSGPPQTTAIGALVNHILKAAPEDYQPMNSNWGLFPPLEGRLKKAEKRLRLISRATWDFRKWLYDSGVA